MFKYFHDFTNGSRQTDRHRLTSIPGPLYTIQGSTSIYNVIYTGFGLKISKNVIYTGRYIYWLDFVNF